SSRASGRAARGGPAPACATTPSCRRTRAPEGVANGTEARRPFFWQDGRFRKAVMTRQPLLHLAPALLLLAACGGSPAGLDLGPPVASGGMDLGVDAGAHDAGVDMGIVYPPGTTCDMPMVVTGDASMRVSVTYDTTHDPAGMRDFGEHCANPDPGMGAGRFP